MIKINVTIIFNNYKRTEMSNSNRKPSRTSTQKVNKRNFEVLASGPFFP